MNRVDRSEAFIASGKSLVTDRAPKGAGRCTKWIEGRQCHHFALPGEPRGRCALHGIGSRDR